MLGRSGNAGWVDRSRYCELGNLSGRYRQDRSASDARLDPAKLPRQTDRKMNQAPTVFGHAQNDRTAR